jgi:pyruvate dehydrogenase E2 component (dihydrolipoyllysine-residue acetyltransferase)
MADFKLPELGENIAAGDVVRVLVKPGDTIAKDQPVIELETDKATIEVPSSVAGVVKEVQVKPGQKVKVGQTVLTVEGEGEAAAKPAAAEPKAAEAKAPEPETKEKEEEPAEEPEPEAPRPKRGEVVDISRAPRPASQPAAVDSTASAGSAPPAAPSVRRIARELGVDVRQVNGSGPGGRITVDDVQGFVRQALAGGGPSTGPGAGGSAPAAAQQPLPDFSKFGDIERKPLSNIRRKTAEHLGHAWNVIPHVTNHDKADITALEELRKKYGPQAERAGGKLTFTVVALKILASAIRKYPQFAAAIDMGKGQLVYKKYTHMGVAVDTDRGLLVPVLRDVDKKGIIELSAELAKLSEKARAGKLSLDEMSGGVMTITNLGGIGGVGFTPIVNWPEVAILGISRGSMEPIWNGREFQPRLMLPLSLSYDHRVIDGADAARFLRFVAEAFEQPFVLAL